jgi:hypothetical protein
LSLQRPTEGLADRKAVESCPNGQLFINEVDDGLRRSDTWGVSVLDQPVPDRNET